MHERVLVVLNPGGSERLLPWLRRVLGGRTPDLYLLSVQLPQGGVVVGRQRVSYAHQAEEAVRAEVLVRLGAAAARFKDEGFHVTTDVRFGYPVATVLRTAAELQAGLIVLAVQERRWWARSVDDEILRRATVPVLTVPRPTRRAA
jgi:nucleotide-binding universal stress UspA family protein